MTLLTGLAHKLVATKILPQDVVEKAVVSAEAEEVSFVTHIVGHKIIAASKLAEIASVEFGFPYLDLDSFDVEHIPKLQMKTNVIDKYNILPIFKRGDKLFVAVSDPSNLRALEDIKFQTSTNPEPIVVEEDKLQELLKGAISQQEMESLGDLEDEDLESLDISSGEEDFGAIETGVDDTPIVRFVNKMLLDAIHSGASDIHFEPYEKTYRVRFRQDGILFEHAKPPANLSPRLSARLKVMSQLDISERRVPQDGRFKMHLTKSRAVDFRVSSCPTLFGEKIVLRVLDPTSAKLGINALGYTEEQKKLFMDAIHKPQGMVLVTGPTGSGKTVSLYTALNILNTDERNISTAEDPAEINLSGINQVNVNVKAGLTFASALRSFLRQDPDIVMVGEIRDLETAEISVKAAQTGHLVLSTLHTNSAAETLTRLMNMGIPTFNLATSITLIIAQRLARKLCEKCKKVIEIPKSSLLEVGFKEQDIKEDLIMYEAEGCPSCKDGYKGRIGLYEVMPITLDISNIILAGGNALQIQEIAQKNGIPTLREAGLQKVTQGLTTLVEIDRVVKD
jgi:type IV pilus assembly protein PilB